MVITHDIKINGKLEMGLIISVGQQKEKEITPHESPNGVIRSYCKQSSLFRYSEQSVHKLHASLKINGNRC